MHQVERGGGREVEEEEGGGRRRRWRWRWLTSSTKPRTSSPTENLFLNKAAASIGTDESRRLEGRKGRNMAGEREEWREAPFLSSELQNTEGGSLLAHFSEGRRRRRRGPGRYNCGPTL